MDLLDEEIAELEEEIRGYKYEYKTAGPEDKRQLRQVITARSQTLNRLLDARNTAATAAAVTSGPSIEPPFSVHRLNPPATDIRDLDLNRIFCRNRNECVKWSCIIRHSPAGVRRQVMSFLLRNGIRHGFVKRTGDFEVEVCIVCTFIPENMTEIFVYFATVWGVVLEDTTEVELRNTTDVHLLGYKFSMLKYPENKEEASSEDLDDVSEQGWEVKSLESPACP